ELKVSQPYKVMAVNGTAKVQCLIDPQPSYNDVYSSANQNFKYPYPNPQEIRVTLIKGLHSSHRFCSNTLNFTDHRWVDMAKHGQDGLELTVSGLQAIHTDLYRCKIEVMYPPPYLRLTGNATLIHIKSSKSALLWLYWQHWSCLFSSSSSSSRSEQKKQNKKTNKKKNPLKCVYSIYNFADFSSFRFVFSLYINNL
uniref:Immunoglobulin V-set domain-containing protein n=1 Tax=Cynoglossus semilaevis TaxID=244447 RepID=A0A3P8V365_CYNSE